MSLSQDNPTEIEGQIERITYTNEETGYTVARAGVLGYPESVTLVGKMIAPAPGEIIKMKGVWQNHKKFGRQFKVFSHHTSVPATVKGIRKYLGSGLIKGIGPVMAERIVKEFGNQTLKIIENRISELEKIEGIGGKRIEMIKRAWDEQRDIRDIMIFLQAHDIGPAHAVRIFKRYSHDSISVLKNTPYRLASDIHGIGFTTADRIAKNLGFDKNDPARAEAGIMYVLGQISEEGHVYTPYEELTKKCIQILDIERDIIVNALGSITEQGKIVIEDFRPIDKSVYLSQHYQVETAIAALLGRLISSKKAVRRINADKATAWVQGKINLELAQNQINAIKKTLSQKVMLITGGPGTGKTTIINAIIRIFRETGARILLAAPTGRASKRLSEATGYPAQTIHRMLEFSFQKGGFQRNQEHPLNVDILIIDEVSMMDVILMAHLLRAVPTGTVLVLVGDVDQLPSVGPGSVLKDIIQSGVVQVARLTEIFRQADESRIIVSAHKINQGIMPETREQGRGLQDFYFIAQDDPEKVLRIINDLVCERIPKRFHLDPLEDIQVLSPMHKGIVGTVSLNAELQNALNQSKVELSRGGRTFRLGDKVIQIKNNYEKTVFNGDIGRITAIDPENQEVTILFDGIYVPYDFSELDEIVLAYAISVHKSQGSEYPAVIVPILSQHYVLLQRNLIYTAVTRGKKLVIIIGSKKAFAMGIKNNRIRERYSHLAERLKGV